MRGATKVAIAIGILATGLICSGQEVEEQAGEIASAGQAGSLSGIVFCADTNGPARLAHVNLVRYSETSYFSRMFAVTDLDGRFVLRNIPAGEYYLATVLPGYVDWLNALVRAHLDAMSAEDRKKMLAQIPKVTISSSQPAHASIRLERSAEIDGTVLYDDGSPAPGLIVSYQKLAAGESPTDQWTELGIPNTYSGPSLTDDQGHFRILGVSSGDYLVRATVPIRAMELENVPGYVHMLESPFEGLSVYGGGGFRASKAEKIKVGAGGATKSADIVIPLSKLHTVRGHILLKSTKQPPPWANIRLFYSDTQEQARSQFTANGAFEFDYVPEESLVLKAVASASAPPNPDDYVGQSLYRITWSSPRLRKDSPEVPLRVVGDVDNVSIMVPDPSPTDERGQTMELMVGTREVQSTTDASH